MSLHVKFRQIKGFHEQLISRSVVRFMITLRSFGWTLAIERLHVMSHVQVVVYSLGLTVLIYGTLAYLRMKLFLKTKLTDAE